MWYVYIYISLSFYLGGLGLQPWTIRWIPPRRRRSNKRVILEWSKKTISKTTQKPSVPMAQYILVDIILSSSILTCFSLLWCLARCLRSGGRSLTSSAACTPSFAAWVLQHHLVAGGTGSTIFRCFFIGCISPKIRIWAVYFFWHLHSQIAVEYRYIYIY